MTSAHSALGSFLLSLLLDEFIQEFYPAPSALGYGKKVSGHTHRLLAHSELTSSLLAP